MRRLPVRTRVKAIRALHRGGLAVPAGSHGIVTGAGRARFHFRTTYTVVFTPGRYVRCQSDADRPDLSGAEISGGDSRN
jgi:hypothetical protein